ALEEEERPELGELRERGPRHEERRPGAGENEEREAEGGADAGPGREPVAEARREDRAPRRVQLIGERDEERSCRHEAVRRKKASERDAAPPSSRGAPSAARRPLSRSAQRSATSSARASWCVVKKT